MAPPPDRRHLPTDQLTDPAKGLLCCRMTESPGMRASEERAPLWVGGLLPPSHTLSRLQTAWSQLAWGW